MDIILGHSSYYAPAVFFNFLYDSTKTPILQWKQKNDQKAKSSNGEKKVAQVSESLDVHLQEAVAYQQAQQAHDMLVSSDNKLMPILVSFLDKMSDLEFSEFLVAYDNQSLISERHLDSREERPY